MWTALTLGEIERANATAWSVARSSRATGTSTTGGFMIGSGSSGELSVSASATLV